MDGPENRVSLSPWFLPRRCCYSLRIYDDGSSSSSTVLFWWHADADAVQQLIMRQYVEWSGGVEPVEVGGGAGAALHGHGHVRNVQSRPLHDRHHCTVLCCSIIYSPSPGPLCCCPALPLHVLFLAVVRCGRCVQTYTSAIEGPFDPSADCLVPSARVITSSGQGTVPWSTTYERFCVPNRHPNRIQ